MTKKKEEFECGECGSIVKPNEKHYFTDCKKYKKKEIKQVNPYFDLEYGKRMIKEKEEQRKWVMENAIPESWFKQGVMFSSDRAISILKKMKNKHKDNKTFVMIMEELIQEIKNELE